MASARWLASVMALARPSFEVGALLHWPDAIGESCATANRIGLLTKRAPAPSAAASNRVEHRANLAQCSHKPGGFGRGGRELAMCPGPIHHSRLALVRLIVVQLAAEWASERGGRIEADWPRSRRRRQWRVFRQIRNIRDICTFARAGASGQHEVAEWTRARAS